MMTTRAPDPSLLSRVALRRDLLVLGYDDRAIARMVATRQLVRLRHGAYADAAVHAELDDAGRYRMLTRAVVRQARTEVVASHVASAAEHGCPMWGLDLSEVDVTRVDGKTGRREAGVRQHCGTIVDSDVMELNGLKVMRPTRTAIEVTAVAPLESALIVVCDLLRRGLTTKRAIDERYAAMATWPGTLSTDVVLRLARGELASVGEVRTWFLLYLFAIAMPEIQYEIRDETGRVVAIADFAWPELGVYLEFDGLVKYEKYLRPGERASDAVVREKRREEMIYRLTGWRCIRITWNDLATPDSTAAMIRAMLAPRAA